MRKFFSTVLAVSMILTAFSALTVSVSAQTEPKVQTYDFSDALQLSDFFIAGPDNGIWGNWQAVNGKLQVTGNPEANWYGTSIISKNTYDDFTMEFDADVSAAYGVFIRAADDGQGDRTGLNGWFGGNTYAILHWAPCETNASVEIANYNGTGTQLRACGAIGAMTSAHWLITANGNTVSFTITDNNNAENKMTYSFTDENSLYLDGRIGFYNLTAAGVVSFKADNLVITGDPTNAQEGGGEEEPTINDDLIDKTAVQTYDFSDMMQANDFFVCGPNNGRWGDWKIENNILKTVGNTDAQWWGTNFLTQADYQNFKMEFDAIVSASYGVFLRAEDDGKVANSGLNNWFSGNGYVLAHYSPVEDFNSIKVLNMNGKVNGDGAIVENVLYEAGSMKKIQDSAAGHLVHWTVVCNGTDITFIIQDKNDATNKFTYTFNDALYSAGHIGFYNLTFAGVTSLQIDNLVITGAPVSESRKPVWTDDFSNELGDSYSAYGYWWNDFESNISDKVYRGVLGNEGVSDAWNYYYLKDMEFRDVTIDFDVVDFTGNPGSSYGVVLRAEKPAGTTDGDYCYGIMYDGSWCTVGTMDGMWDQVQYSETGPYAFNPTDNGLTVHHWRIVCEGENIYVYFNYSSLPAFSVNDDTFSVGSIGFRTHFFKEDGADPSVEHLTFDNLRVFGTRMGDVNEDNSVDVRDLIRLKKYNLDASTPINESVAELTGDADVNSDDIVRMRKYLIKAVPTVFDYDHV